MGLDRNFLKKILPGGISGVIVKGRGFLNSAFLGLFYRLG